MATDPNLFSRLHKWAARQDENFVTESLAVVLEQLLILVPETGARLVGRLTGGFIEVGPADSGAVEIRTQVDVRKGRPDLEICVPHRLTWIEVKVESPLRTGQLEGYRRLIEESGFAETRLVLLSRYPETYAGMDARPDSEVRWFELAGWLEAELPAISGVSKVAEFLSQQFLAFLTERNMTLTQVGPYLRDGTRALSALLNMLREAAAACKVSPPRLQTDWEGLGLYLEGGKYWIGIEYVEPAILWFGTRCQIDVDAAGRLGRGEIFEQKWVPGRQSWYISADLESEDIHFFSRTKVGQMQWLEGFLHECLKTARSIETPDQPPLPADGEEN